jgi:hypothetical protein
MRRASGQFSTVNSMSASVNSLSSRLPVDGIADDFDDDGPNDDAFESLFVDAKNYTILHN